MLVQLLLFLIGIGLLYAGAELLVKGASDIAATLGIAPLVIGLTIVAFGTSAPELVVTLVASLQGRPGIAIGNIVGSNIANIGLVLGLSAMVYPLAVHVQSVRREVPFLLFVTVLFAGFSFGPKLERWEGVLMLLLFAIFLIYSLNTLRRDQGGAMSSLFPIETSTRPAQSPIRPGGIAKDLIWTFLGIGTLVGGSNLLISAATVIMRALGVSELFVGLTLVAVGTSLPEVATSVVSAYRRESDLCVGNVLGSNLFNLLFVLGTVTVVHPTRLDPDLIHFEIPVLMLFTFVLLPIMWTRFTVQRWEGLLLLVGYIGFIIFLVLHGGALAAG